MSKATKHRGSTPPSNKRSNRSAAPEQPSAALRGQAKRIYSKLLKCYPGARCALDHRNPFELLVATILSAQCTDVRVNMVTPALFKQYPTPEAMAAATRSDIEKLIRSTGFYRNKAKSIHGTSRLLVQQHHGHVPDTMGELLHLPGVARKTANVVLGNAFGKNEGVVVDTHVGRLSRRLGLSQHTDPTKVEKDLVALFPRKNWMLLSHLLISHGRAVCGARKPRCGDCLLAKMCPKEGVDVTIADPIMRT